MILHSSLLHYSLASLYQYVQNTYTTNLNCRVFHIPLLHIDFTLVTSEEDKNRTTLPYVESYSHCTHKSLYCFTFTYDTKICHPIQQLNLYQYRLFTLCTRSKICLTIIKITFKLYSVAIEIQEIQSSYTLERNNDSVEL